jgi:hypothetical protein
MTSKTIPVEEAAKAWMQDPEFRAAYDALEGEFALASALIRARGNVDISPTAPTPQKPAHPRQSRPRR